MRAGSREVAESCLDGITMEMVATYCDRLHSSKPDLAARRIEAIGFQVGQQLAERLVPVDLLACVNFPFGLILYTRDRPRFTDHLEVIKFICKDFWAEVFKKQIDNLKTNHRGVFVLQDTRFRWLTRISVDSPLTPSEANNTTLAAAQAGGKYLYFPCGLIRGALTNLGVPCAVSAEIAALPACSFIIRIKV
ncbi:trafficking protein particle complex subunit 6B isoform X1 [Selaginella moellendorffii]|uniref:trafficking protein particle complex subunit 6B isoform X1 n=1 Tax=Selaginella moellendorffii TaxID=88036 RepID=UPI000D1C91E1|nr:trafficking protein particle complex subunit 6B isoform X1 [Selaginella moellendorffii]XP_024538982.1 trafficking protein particle complex subunit 6B isoform X1 [Selaginella moellendorffii]|eukprot:XP_024527107.1 trafficking protein particle complex subunit 6B isoform X1 [Selaginella moellendorffii]